MTSADECPILPLQALLVICRIAFDSPLILLRSLYIHTLAASPCTCMMRHRGPTQASYMPLLHPYSLRNLIANNQRLLSSLSIAEIGRGGKLLIPMGVSGCPDHTNMLALWARQLQRDCGRDFQMHTLSYARAATLAAIALPGMMQRFELVLPPTAGVPAAPVASLADALYHTIMLAHRAGQI